MTNRQTLPVDWRSMRLPGSRRQAKLAEILRVDHAGEVGAQAIYQGQLEILGNTPLAPTLQTMLTQEESHLAFFQNAIISHQARPSLLLPLWRRLGIAVGRITARRGPEAALACTVAVEAVISDHYQSQIDELKADAKAKARAKGNQPVETTKAYADLATKLEIFRDEETEHHDLSLAKGAEQAKFYGPQTKLIGLLTKLAITIAKRV